MDFELLLNAFIEISKGIPVSIILVVSSGILGLLLAILVNVGKKNKLFRPIISLYVAIFTGTPLFLQLFFIYYGVGGLVSNCSVLHVGLLGFLFKNAFIYALITMALNTAAYSSAIIKTALDTIPTGQREAAKALGLNSWQTFKRILLPQAFYYALPAYSNEIILLVKASSLASIITVMEITGYMQQVFSSTYSFYEPFIVAALYYLLINFTIIFLVKVLEKRAVKWLNRGTISI